MTCVPSFSTAAHSRTVLNVQMARERIERGSPTSDRTLHQEANRAQRGMARLLADQQAEVPQPVSSTHRPKIRPTVVIGQGVLGSSKKPHPGRTRRAAGPDRRRSCAARRAAPSAAGAQRAPRARTGDPKPGQRRRDGVCGGRGTGARPVVLSRIVNFRCVRSQPEPVCPRHSRRRSGQRPAWGQPRGFARPAA